MGGKQEASTQYVVVDQRLHNGSMGPGEPVPHVDTTISSHIFSPKPVANVPMFVETLCRVKNVQVIHQCLPETQVSSLDG
jgi:hypothetical protein